MIYVSYWPTQYLQHPQCEPNKCTPYATRSARPIETVPRDTRHSCYIID